MTLSSYYAFPFVHDGPERYFLIKMQHTVRLLSLFPALRPKYDYPLHSLCWWNDRCSGKDLLGFVLEAAALALLPAVLPRCRQALEECSFALRQDLHDFRIEADDLRVVRSALAQHRLLHIVEPALGGVLQSIDHCLQVLGVFRG